MKIISFRRQKPKREITYRKQEQTLKHATSTSTCKNALKCGKIVVECYTNYGELQTTKF